MTPLNLGLRFLLELAALAGFAAWVFSSVTGWWRYLLALALVLLIVGLWTTFAVPGDPSRSGTAPVPVPGSVRLVLEMVVLVWGAYAWHASGYSRVGLLLSVLIGLHYLFSLKRVAWLLQQ